MPKASKRYLVRWVTSWSCSTYQKAAHRWPLAFMLPRNRGDERESKWGALGCARVAWHVILQGHGEGPCGNLPAPHIVGATYAVSNDNATHTSEQ